MATGTLPIALDAMGGDDAPKPAVEGALQAAADGIPVALFGRTEVLEPLLATATKNCPLPPERIAELISIHEAPDVIEMSEDPARAARSKKSSSLMRAIAAVRNKEASSIVSAGNTGAAAAGALLGLRRLRGVARPAIATPLPVPGRLPVVLLDSGAMADCQPSWLHQFARMGSTFFKLRFYAGESSAAAQPDAAAPKVGLMSIGEEPEKGNLLVKATHKLLADDDQLNFIGNIEGRDVLNGVADVVVTDGFTGNVVLKTLEGAAEFFAGLIMNRLNTEKEVGDAALRLLAPLVQEIAPEQVGGAMLLGVRGVCIISHGSSNAVAICNAVRAGHAMAAAGLQDELAASVQGVTAGTAEQAAEEPATKPAAEPAD